MKISYMLKREDFYTINENTLKTYYRDSQTPTRLYIYPALNAIVTARPAKAVRQYLYTEFRVSGSLLKRLLVRLYAALCLNSFGLLASRSIRLPADADAHTLIYPCNKKYRIFHFRENTVTVLGKDTFPTDDLQQEIRFRTGHTAPFIPGLVRSDASGYTEQIIDGQPVARTGSRMGQLCDRAFGIWSEYIAPHTQSVPASQYAATLSEELQALQAKAASLEKTYNRPLLTQLTQHLLAQLQTEEAIPVSLSHGDLQPGNLWVERHTDKLYIIDWESWHTRSTWYDRALLYEQLRKQAGLARFAATRDLTHATVLLEDILFRLRELTTLPLHYGCREFDTYLQTLQGGIAHV